MLTVFVYLYCDLMKLCIWLAPYTTFIQLESVFVTYEIVDLRAINIYRYHVKIPLLSYLAMSVRPFVRLHFNINLKIKRSFSEI